MENSNNPGTQLNKFISTAGICSRRKAESLIKSGLVTVNNITVKDPGFRVSSVDLVKYKGKLIKAAEKIYILLNKPKNYITTVSDEKDRKTVLDLITLDTKERIYPVGRLDRATTGLLIITNDGEFSQKLAHPSSKVDKSYEIEIDKPLTPEDFAKIKAGLKLEDGFIKVGSIRYAGDKKNILKITLHSGKNRIIRRIFEFLGYKVTKLDRYQYANLTKKNLAIGDWRFLTKSEVDKLYNYSK